MNKPILILSIILVFILFILIIISSSLKNVVINNSSITPVPTAIVDFQTDLTNDKTTQLSPAEEARMIEQVKSLRPLTQSQIEALQKLADQTPKSTDDFEIEYSPDLLQFFVREKTPQAAEKLKEFFASDTLMDIYANSGSYNNIFVKGTAPTNNLRKKAEQDYYLKKTLRKVYFRPTPTPIPTDSPAKRDAKLIGGFVRMFTNIDLINLPRPTVTPEPEEGVSSSTTPVNGISLDTSNPLDAIFNEAGQKVGTPPLLLKGLMAHECGDLLNEKPENIITWSQPGAGLPPNHYCFDAGAKGDGVDMGPMQQTLRWYQYYLTAVNRIGGYTHAPYVENIRDAVFATAEAMRKNSGATDINWTCEQVKLAAFANAGQRHPKRQELFNYMWGYYTQGSPANSTPC